MKARVVVSCRLCCLSGARFLVPDIEGDGADLAIDTGCQSVSAGMEVTVDEGVSGEEVLGLSGRSEALHLPLSSSCRTMRVSARLLR
jgi:hypothetical protein